MKRLLALLVAAVFSVTPVLAAKQFYDNKATDWSIAGVYGSEDDGELAHMACYTLLERGTMRMLVGLDLETAELFILLNDSTWNFTSIPPSPPEPPNVPDTADFPRGFIDFSVGTSGVVWMQVTAKDRVAIRHIDPNTFIPALAGSLSIDVYNDIVPRTTIDLTGLQEAFTLMGKCIDEGQALKEKAANPGVSA